MLAKHVSAPSILACAALVASCSDRAESEKRAEVTAASPARTAPVSVGQGEIRHLGPQVLSLPECDPSVPAPNRALVLRVRNLNIHNFNDIMVSKPTNAAKDDEEQGAANERRPKLEARPGRETPIDVNLELARGESVLIKIDVLNPNVTVAPNETINGKLQVFALTAGDAEGYAMLCGPRRKSDKIATVIAHSGGVAPATWGSYNFGLMVKQPGNPRRMLPIYIDPNIKNNG